MRKKVNKILNFLFRQSYKNFKIIISDNCSNDRTVEICKKVEKKGKNLIIFRQKKKININKNFYFVYSKSTTKYFMWMAADDLKSKNFIKDNLHFLEKIQNIQLLAAKVLLRLIKPKKKKIVDFNITGNISFKYSKFFDNCFDSYGIFLLIISKSRSKKIKKIFKLYGLGLDCKFNNFRKWRF